MQASQAGDTESGEPPARINQIIKIVVYSLLAVNFAVYVANDHELATRTVHDGWNLLDWTTAYATSLDTTAWFVLLILFELETHTLPDEAFTPARLRLMHGIRMVCYLFLAHTLFALGEYVVDLGRVEPIEQSNLCEMADAGVSFAHNLEYIDIRADNCENLTGHSTLYLFEEGTLITDSAGMVIEKRLAWIDLMEAVVWLAILFLIEFIVRLQERGVTTGTSLRLALVSKMSLFALLWGAAAYWISLGHWVFAWDEALWMLGFTAISMNLSQWREELDQEKAVGTELPNC